MKNFKIIFNIFALALLAALGGLLSASCNTGGDAKNIAEGLEDTLTDSMEFDNGTVEKGAPPEGSGDADAPQITEVSPPPDGFAVGSAFYFIIKTGYANLADIDKTFLFVEKATKYISIISSAVTVSDHGEVRISGTLKSEDKLLNKDFGLKFALHAKNGKTGLYVPLTIHVSELKPTGDAKTLASEALADIQFSSEAQWSDSGRPEGSSDQSAPQVDSIDAPATVRIGETVAITLYSSNIEDPAKVKAVLLGSPSLPGYYRITGFNVINSARKAAVSSYGFRVTFIVNRAPGANFKPVFLLALQNESGASGQYYPWQANYGESTLDGDEEAAAEAEEETETAEEAEIADETEVPAEEELEEEAEEPSEEEDAPEDFAPNGIGGFSIQFNEQGGPSNVWLFPAGSNTSGGAILVGTGEFPFTYEKTGVSASTIIFDVGGSDKYEMIWTNPTSGTFNESFNGTPGTTGQFVVTPLTDGDEEEEETQPTNCELAGGYCFSGDSCAPGYVFASTPMDCPVSCCIASAADGDEESAQEEEIIDEEEVDTDPPVYGFSEFYRFGETPYGNAISMDGFEGSANKRLCVLYMPNGPAAAECYDGAQWSDYSQNLSTAGITDIAVYGDTLYGVNGWSSSQTSDLFIYDMTDGWKEQPVSGYPFADLNTKFIRKGSGWLYLSGAKTADYTPTLYKTSIGTYEAVEIELKDEHGTPVTFLGIAASSEGDVIFAAGSTGLFASVEGGVFQKVYENSSYFSVYDYSSFHAKSPTDVWITGSGDDGNMTQLVLGHFDGESLVYYETGMGASDAGTKVWGMGPDSAFFTMGYGLFLLDAVNLTAAPIPYDIDKKQGDGEKVFYGTGPDFMFMSVGLLLDKLTDSYVPKPKNYGFTTVNTENQWNGIARLTGNTQNQLSPCYIYRGTETAGVTCNDMSKGTWTPLPEQYDVWPLDLAVGPYETYVYGTGGTQLMKYPGLSDNPWDSVVLTGYDGGNRQPKRIVYGAANCYYATLNYNVFTSNYEVFAMNFCAKTAWSLGGVPSQEEVYDIYAIENQSTKKGDFDFPVNVFIVAASGVYKSEKAADFVSAFDQSMIKFNGPGYISGSYSSGIWVSGNDPATDSGLMLAHFNGLIWSFFPIDMAGNPANVWGASDKEALFVVGGMPYLFTKPTAIKSESSFLPIPADAYGIKGFWGDGFELIFAFTSKKIMRIVEDYQPPVVDGDEETGEYEAEEPSEEEDAPIDYAPGGVGGLSIQLNEQGGPSNVWTFPAGSETSGVATLSGVGDFQFSYEKTGASLSTLIFNVGGFDKYDMTWTSPTSGYFNESFNGAPGTTGYFEVLQPGADGDMESGEYESESPAEEEQDEESAQSCVYMQDKAYCDADGMTIFDCSQENVYQPASCANIFDANSSCISCGTMGAVCGNQCNPYSETYCVGDYEVHCLQCPGTESIGYESRSDCSQIGYCVTVNGKGSCALGGTVKGIVLNSTQFGKMPVADALVTLKLPSGETLTANSSAEGFFKFHNVRPGVGALISAKPKDAAPGETMSKFSMRIDVFPEKTTDLRLYSLQGCAAGGFEEPIDENYTASLSGACPWLMSEASITIPYAGDDRQIFEGLDYAGISEINLVPLSLYDQSMALALPGTTTEGRLLEESVRPIMGITAAYLEARADNDPNGELEFSQLYLSMAQPTLTLPHGAGEELDGDMVFVFRYEESLGIWTQQEVSFTSDSASVTFPVSKTGWYMLATVLGTTFCAAGEVYDGEDVPTDAVVEAYSKVGFFKSVSPMGTTAGAFNTALAPMGDNVLTASWYDGTGNRYEANTIISGGVKKPSNKFGKDGCGFSETFWLEKANPQCVDVRVYDNNSNPIVATLAIYTNLTEMPEPMIYRGRYYANLDEALDEGRFCMMAMNNYMYYRAKLWQGANRDICYNNDEQYFYVHEDETGDEPEACGGESSCNITNIMFYCQGS